VGERNADGGCECDALAICQPSMYALLPSLVAAQFPAEIRCSGVSVCFQIAAAIGGRISREPGDGRQREGVNDLSSLLPVCLDAATPDRLHLCVAGALFTQGTKRTP
jgi:hypothetical protein